MNKNDEEYISIIIPTWNRASFLEKAVTSVLRQTYKNFELIIIDDGSDDETDSLIRSLDDPRLHYLYQENLGVSAARNTGIKKSKGAILAFLDSDDYWIEEKLEKQYEFMQRTLSDVSHTQEIWYRSGKILHQKKKHRKESGDLFHRSLEICCISISTVMVRKEVFDCVGYFDESFPACEDYDMWLKVTSRYPVFLLDEELTIKDGGRPDQLSHKIPMLDQYRIKAICNIIEGGELDQRQIGHALRMLERKSSIYIRGCRKYGRNDEADRFEHMVHEILKNYGEMSA